MKWLLFLNLLAGVLSAETFYVKHAVSEIDRVKGLMGVKSLPNNKGMLFHFPKEGLYSFWGWGCYLDLGVAYLNNQGEVLEIAHLETFPTDAPPNFLHPFFKKSYIPKNRSTYVLEMQWSWFNEVSLSIGDRVTVNSTMSAQEILK